MRDEKLEAFYLAGGTNLSLQIGQLHVVTFFLFSPLFRSYNGKECGVEHWGH